MGMLVIYQLNFGKIHIEDEPSAEVDAEKRAAQKRWDTYIAAMRGYLSSHLMDANKVDVHFARMRAEERVWREG
jgi:hypothetical protein